MTLREDIEGLDAAILMHPRTWEASGHVEQFADPMIDNRTSKARYRADTLIEEFIERLRKKGKHDQADALDARLRAAQPQTTTTQSSPKRKSPIRSAGHATGRPVRFFNLMFKTFVGPVEDASSVVYLRPETAQGIFVNFKNVLDSSRRKLPFGIAQIGKAFRNEINTKYFLYRTREFEQMEMQYFIPPGSEQQYFDYWLNERWQWFLSLGMSHDVLRIKPHEKLAHYATAAADIEFKFPFGWGEIEGIPFPN